MNQQEGSGCWHHLHRFCSWLNSLSLLSPNLPGTLQHVTVFQLFLPLQMLKIHCRHQVTRHDSVVSVRIVIAVAIATSVWRWRTMASFPGDLDSLAATTICDRPLCQISAFDLYGLTRFVFSESRLLSLESVL